MSETNTPSPPSRKDADDTSLSPQQHTARGFAAPRAECVFEIDPALRPVGLDIQVAQLIETHGLHAWLAQTGVPGVRARETSLPTGVVRITLDAPACLVDGPSLLVLCRQFLGETAGPVISHQEIAAWQWELLEGPGAVGAKQRYAARTEAQPRAFQLPFASSAGDGPWHGRTCSVPLDDLPDAGNRDAAVFLAAWWGLLHLVTGVDDLLTAVVTSGRSLSELADVVAPLAKHLPVSAHDVGRMGLGGLKQRAAAELKAAAEWHPSHDPRTPGPATCFEFLPADLPEGVRLVEMAAHVAPFDLKLTVTVTGGACWAAQLHYNSRSIAPQIADHLARLYADVLGAMIAAPGCPVDQLALKPATRVGQARSIVQAPRSVEQAVLEQAARSPERLAVICGDTSLRYGALAQQSTALAQKLLAAGAGPETRVAFELDGSVNAVVAILGILQAGAAYVPLAHGLPEQRKSNLLASVGADILLSDAWFEDGDAPVSPLPTTSPPDHALAYVLFTSGSTGTPKPVAVERCHLMSYLGGLRDRMGHVEGLTWASVTSLATDLGNTSLFGAMAHGGTLVLADRAAATEAAHLRNAFSKTPVDVLKITGSHLDALLDMPGGVDVLPMRHLILGGEVLPRRLAERLADLKPDLTIWNHYGPTETTIGCAMHQVNVGRPESALPLGLPLVQGDIRVLNRAGQPMPPLVVGELGVSGKSVSRGYLGQQRQTAARFVPDPLSSEPGARMYRTGDLGWIDPNGLVHFLRRADRQIKLRGHRVELAEIEALLMGAPAVAAASVICKNCALHAFVVAAQGADIHADGLKDQLRALLPDYMVPQTIRDLRALPRTPSGKVDHAKLAASFTEMAQANDPAGSTLERELGAIWSDALGVQVGVDDDFFELGGHSLAAMRIAAKVYQDYGTHLPLLTLFEARTPRALAAKLAEAR